ncbi:MAG: cadherin-like domain-containing protein, partial [Hormoscilla sp. SP5CHS1]|nr:cadherin-like domain-containing protein [Hormoscilla sp. SP5CHS1]
MKKFGNHMIWNTDNNDQLLTITNQLTDEALIRKSINATKTIANDTDQYVDELNTDADEYIDIFDRIICQFLLWLTSHHLENLTKEIVARYKAGRNVEHIIAYLQMLIGFISREPHLFEIVLGTTDIINVFANDTGGNKDDLSITDFSETSSQGVMIASDENNGLRYTSAADGFRGINSFEYSISDENGGTDSATSATSATVTITMSNEASDAVNNEPTTGFSETLSQGGAIASDGNSLQYTPADGFAGTDSFEYSIS